MTIPATATAFEQPLAPKDVVDYYVVVTQGKADAKPPTVLLLGEAIADYELTLSVEAIAAGLQIVEAEGYENHLTGNVLTLWLRLDPTMVGAPMFAGAGVIVAIEMLIKTTSDPTRTKARSFLVRITNQ